MRFGNGEKNCLKGGRCQFGNGATQAKLTNAFVPGIFRAQGEKSARGSLQCSTFREIHVGYETGTDWGAETETDASSARERGCVLRGGERSLKSPAFFCSN